MAKLVSEAMSGNPRTVKPESMVVEAARLLAEEDIGSVPVVEPGFRLRGILTDRDIAIRVVAAGLDPNTTKVESVASTEVAWVYPEEPLDEAIAMMAKRQIRRLPVVDENQRLVGILAQADVVHELKDKQAGKLVEEISQPAPPISG
jgi:CBS domain-containing protein